MVDLVSTDMNSQFQLLVRHFLWRFFHRDGASDDERYVRILQILATLAVPGLLISFFLIPDHPPGSLIMAGAETEAERVWLRVGDRYVFVAYAMTAMGLLMAFQWDSLFPDREDYLILTSLPISSPRWFAAKIVSLALFLSMFILATNVFSLAIVPPIVAEHIGGGLNVFVQAFAAHASATLGGSVCAALFFLALQGLLINVVPANTFRRISPFIQTVATFILLTTFLITPLIKESIPPLARSHSPVLSYIPMIWFLGIYEHFLPGGTPLTETGYWARLAVAAITGMVPIVLVSYWLGYRRYSKKVLEAAFPMDSAMRTFRFATTVVDRIFLKNETERATFHFVAQIYRRSSKHRILTALYTAIGAALAISSLFVIDTQSSQALSIRLSFSGSLEIPLTLTFVMIAGLRATFAVPYELHANWIFRLAGSVSPEPFLNATRKWITMCRIAPLFILFAIFEFWRFGPMTALCQLAFDTVSAAVLFEAFFLKYNRVVRRQLLFPVNDN